MGFRVSAKNHLIIRYLITIIILLTIIAPAGSFAATQLSQFGITWRFDGDYPTGQFANGDYWVIGPVVITSINPPSTSGGRVMNGSMLNPSPRSGMMQGYDSAMYGQYGPAYSNTLNVALNVSSSNPLVIPAGNSLVSTISISTAGNNPQLQTAAVLTVLDQAPPEGSFRPPYSGTDKTIRFNVSQLDYSLLSSLPPVPSTPSLASVERYFERPWIDHIGEWLGGFQHPSSNMPNYGREISTQTGTGSLMLHLNFSNAQKETLLIRYVQLGIDLFGIVQDGGSHVWIPDGGHASGRKWPILFAGLLLNDVDMMSIGRPDVPGFDASHPDYVHFGEDSQTFYVDQATLSTGSGYTSADIGLPEWGIRHATHPQFDSKTWALAYRQCCTGNCWAGQALSARIMGVRDLWNHNAFFDYQDRYMGIESGWYRQMAQFPEDMWDTYRADYGGIWPNSTPPESDLIPPLPPSNLTATDITSNSITLSWTEPPQAEDGDFATGYRIFRNGQSVGSSNTTSYTDTGLDPLTTYDYSVLSNDNSGNASETSADGSFTTIESTNGGGNGNGGTTPPTTPPTINPPPAGDLYYISPDGSDSNPGTSWSQALRNLPATLQRNATYYFAGGTYNDYTFNDPASGTQYTTIRKATAADHGTETGWNAAYATNQAVFGEFNFTGASYVFFDGASPAQTVIRWNNNSAGGGSTIGISNSNNITILNADVDGHFRASGNSQTDGSCNVFGMNGASNITIYGCLIHDGADDGLEIFSCNNLNISYNEVYDLHGCGTDGGCGPCYNGHSDGFEVFNVKNSQFVGNFIHNIPSTSAFFFGGWAASSAEYCTNILMANNIIYNNANTGFLAYIQMADGVRLYNNTFWGQAGGAYGGLAIGNVFNLEMYNNIILSINFAHMGQSYNASRHRGDYNCFGSAIGQYPPQANDIVAPDPGFAGINGASGPLISVVNRDDFMLTETSPCIDSGTTIDLATDIAGNPRPIGSAFDRGAFEYGTPGPDIRPPQVSAISYGETYVTVTFDESVDSDTAVNTGNYSINNNITVNSASLNQQANTVTLDTSAHSTNVTYTITIGGVEDLAGNVMDQVAYEYTFVQDLVGNWQFNDTGTTSEDSSDFGNTANLINGATTDGSGRVTLDGVDDAIEVSMENMQTSAGTIAVLARQSDSTGSQYLFGHTIGTWSNRLQLYLDNGSLALGLGNSHTTQTGIEQFLPDQPYLVALTWNGTEYSLYVNGQLRASGNYSGLDNLNSIADFGNNGNTDLRNETLNGSIEEAWAFNYVLSAEDIAALGTVGPPVEPETDPVGHWNFSETAGTIASDSSEYDNTGQLINGATFSGDGHVVLDGIDDAVQVSMENMTPSAGTVVVIAQQSDPTGSQYLFGHTIGTWSNRIQIYLENGTLSLGLGDTHTTQTAIELFVAGQTYIVALTWNAGQYAFYVNGQPRASGNYTGLSDLNSFADIGNDGNTDLRDESLNGQISQARIYNYALTAEQIAAITDNGTTPPAPTPLEGSWKFNETEGTTANDSSGSNNTALLVNGASFTGDGSVTFDGTEGAIEVSMSNMQASTGTVALRFIPTGYSSDPLLSNYLFGHCAADWSQRIQLYLRQGSLTLGLGDNHELATGIDTLTTGQSYHVALTWDAGTYAVYVDGTQSTSGIYSGLNTLSATADFGNDGNPPYRVEPFEGLIEEARIYSTSLSADQVADLAAGIADKYETLNLVMMYWLDYHPDADIAPPGGDGKVNLLDLAKLAENWVLESPTPLQE